MRELPVDSGEVCRRRQNYTERTCNDHEPKADNGGAENVMGNFFDHAGPHGRQHQSIGCSPQRNSAVKLKRQRKCTLPCNDAQAGKSVSRRPTFFAAAQLYTGTLF
jgi:hypothetical protein